MQERMRVVAVVAQKGGTGKSMVTANLAAAASASGWRTVVVDTDPQGAVVDWKRARDADDVVVLSAKAAAVPAIRAAADRSGADFLVIDTCPATLDSMIDAVRVADLTLVVVRPTSVDLRAIAGTVSSLRAARRPAAFVLNQAQSQRTGRELPLMAEAVELLLRYKLPVAPVALRNRGVYQTAFARGRSPQEIDPRGRANAELNVLWTYVCERLSLQIPAAPSPKEEGLESAVLLAAAKGDPYRSAQRLIRRGEWREGVAAFADIAATGAAAGALDKLLLKIAALRLAETEDALAQIDSTLLREANGVDDWRRLVVRPLLSTNKLDLVVAALGKVLEAFPNDANDRRSLARTLAQLERWDEAIAEADAAALLEPDNLSLIAARIRYRMSSGDATGAAELARSAGDRFSGDDAEEASIAMAALRRVQDYEGAAGIAARMDPTRFPDPQTAAAAVHSLLASGRAAEAIRAAEGALKIGLDSPALRSHLNQALLTHTAKEAEAADVG